MEKSFLIDHSCTIHFTKEPEYGFESVAITWIEDGELKSKIKINNHTVILIFDLNKASQEEVRDWLKEHYPKNEWRMWSVQYYCWKRIDKRVA